VRYSLIELEHLGQQGHQPLACVVHGAGRYRRAAGRRSMLSRRGRLRART